MSATDGGPAFPVHEQWNEWSELKAEYQPKTGPRGGMSLRDYFAAQSIAGQLAAYSGDELAFPNPADAAMYAYKLADAMIAERAK
jgi:hypothetical protein